MASDLEESLAFQIKAVGLPEPVREHTFAKPRRWRFDFAWPDILLAVEVEGGVWNRGRHGRGSGIVGDIEKGNAAAMRGWRMLRVTGDMVKKGEAVRLIEEWFKREKDE
jgi:very-short-patch-repair endonuclease